MSHRNGVFNNLKQQCIFTNDRRTRFKSSFKTLGEHLKNQNKLFFPAQHSGVCIRQRQTYK